MSVAAVTCRWSGFVGGPGYTKLYFTGADANGSQPITDVIAESARTTARTFFINCAPMLPQAVKIDVLPTVEEFEIVSGVLLSEFSGDPLATVSGSATGSYQGASGVMLHWLTNDIAAGRRVRGRTFLVPASWQMFDETGTVSSSGLTLLNTAGTAMLDATNNAEDSQFVVWRGRGAGQAGSTHAVTAFRAPDMSVVLRSRRD